MANQEKIRELFGSLSEESESPPASPPPGAWPPPVDPSRRYPVPRVGTSVQRGDGSQRGHTRWLEELPPALPKAPRKSQGRPRALPDPAAGTTKTTTARSGKGPGQATTTDPQGSTKKLQPTRASSTSSSDSRRTDGGPAKTAAYKAHRGETEDVGTSRPPRPTESAKTPTRRHQRSPPRQGPTIRAMEVIQPARREPKNIAGIEISMPDKNQTGLTATPGGPPAHGRAARLKAPRIRPAIAATTAKLATARTRGGTISSSTAVRLPTTANAPAVLPLPPFALELRRATAPPVATSPMAPVVPPTTTPAAPPQTSPASPPPPSLTAPSPTLATVTSPTPPAYIREKEWTSRPGIPLAVPIQLPNGEITSVPMSAIRHNRKWRARTATGKWLLRFAPDGRLSMCRKIQGEAFD
ncbi:hypothetical protein PUN28_015276 [Cardiocondyla obscurior]|uniref:Uncharacterized protein n=1 Tax=Cardiocondyla obscurior TaxID=286306 RepID=A0AAW2F0H3_9HYME